MLDFFALAADVFRGERIDREDADPDVEAPFEHLLQLVAALSVAIEDVAQTDLPREPAVPVHDDCDVPGDRGLLDLVEEATLVRLVGGVADDFRDVRRHRRTPHEWDRPIYPFAGTPPPDASGGGFVAADEAVSRISAAKLFKDGARLVPPFHSSRQRDLVALSMKSVEYQDLYRKLATPEDIDFLAENAGYDKELLLVIYTQRIVRETTKKFYRVKAQARRLAFMWQNGSSLLEIARKFEFPPILTALMVLEQRKISRKQFWKMINELDSVKDRRVRPGLREGEHGDIVYSAQRSPRQHGRRRGGEAELPTWREARR